MKYTIQQRKIVTSNLFLPINPAQQAVQAASSLQEKHTTSKSELTRQLQTAQKSIHPGAQ